MCKALRYLKPYWLSVIAIVSLVFAQVQLELALPDYMSNIVTYGIQYSGITSTTPEALHEETLNKMFLFMDEEDINTIKSSYELIEKGNSEYIDEYPSLSTENIYVKKSDATTSIDELLEKPFLIVSMLERSDFGSTNSENIYQTFESNPAMKDGIIAQMEEGIKGYTEDNIKSAKLMMLRNEYQKLGMNIESIQNKYILHEGLIMLGLALLGTICAIASSYLASKTSTGASRNMRNDLFEKVESFSSEEFSRFSTASLITRTTNDIQQVQMIINMMLRIVLFAPMMGFTSLIKVLRYPQLSSILGWAVGILITFMIILFMIASPRFKIIQKLVDRLNLVTREQLSGMLVIRAFNNQKTEEERFNEVNTDITKLNLFLNRLMGLMGPIMTFIMSGVSILIIWIGANAIDLGTMQIGDMMAFIQYATHVLMSFMIVAMIFIMIPRSSVSANRIFEVLETEPSIKDPTSPKTLQEENTTISYNNVSFRYPGAEMNVLENVNFTAEPGETVAFIGSTGSGKSTLINLLPRFFDVSEGSITFGGVDIRDVSQKDLRDKIGYIPQKGTLFSGTVESNLRYADENASSEAIENALEVSQAKEFVEKMPEGIKESISQGGTNVSGGQKQRLSIARALTKKADIYIFDDTFSALDYKTDAKLRDALTKMISKTKATVFIVAQRISTIMNADKIVVLDKGKVVGIGKHEDLLKNCDVYKEIALSQLSEEELAV